VIYKAEFSVSHCPSVIFLICWSSRWISYHHCCAA